MPGPLNAIQELDSLQTLQTPVKAHDGRQSLHILSRVHGFGRGKPTL